MRSDNASAGAKTQKMSKAKGAETQAKLRAVGSAKTQMEEERFQQISVNRWRPTSPDMRKVGTKKLYNKQQ